MAPTKTKTPRKKPAGTGKTDASAGAATPKKRTPRKKGDASKK